MKWFGRLLLLAVVAGLAWWLWQRIFVTDEQRVKHLLSAMTRAVETGNLFKLEDCIAQDYTDDFGFDKSTIIGGVRQFRAQYDALLILITDLKVEVAPDHQTAQAVFIAKILAKAKGSLSETEVRADRFRLTFRQTDAGWKMTRAESPQLKFD